MLVFTTRKETPIDQKNLLRHTILWLIRCRYGKIYGHVYDAEKREAAEKMNPLLAPLAPGLAPDRAAGRLQ